MITPGNSALASARGDELKKDFQELSPYIVLLPGTHGNFQWGPVVDKPKQSARHVHPEFEAYVSLEGLIDVADEIKRQEKQLQEKTRQLQTIQAKLANPNFVNKAPTDVVQQQRDLLVDLQEQIEVLENNLRELRQ